MEEISRKERTRYAVFRGLINGKIVYDKNGSEGSVTDDPRSALETYGKWVRQYGPENISITRERTVEIYETLSLEDLKQLASGK